MRWESSCCFALIGAAHRTDTVSSVSGQNAAGISHQASSRGEFHTKALADPMLWTGREAGGPFAWLSDVQLADLPHMSSAQGPCW